MEMSISFNRRKKNLRRAAGKGKHNGYWLLAIGKG
jgi:hypothetical protein